ncbi:hypothetical protein HNQ74_001281 [Bartonella doshiae]|uniref:Uncharacterized protein n=2 Tax=Bartonella doshiae TaxID=33044 RepID=A0A380ZEG0_BARDO|nr:hypothetical protein MCS_00920 [Bartonella doshiae NCTC 12862 = ATCC 700133]MBB6159841.1 hypothetical protein [Bartonella doshiae]SUV45357.1 Uncharacterised protein [Bartonella doshiae]
MDISNPNKQLGIFLWSASSRMLSMRENSALFLCNYGKSYSCTSNLSTLEYDYRDDLDYNVIKADILLRTIESAYSTIFFGNMRTYSKFYFASDFSNKQFVYFKDVFQFSSFDSSFEAGQAVYLQLFS